MAVPRFFDRVVQALSGVIDGVDIDQLERTLGSTVVVLRAANGMADRPEQRGGFLVAVRIAARLYPSIEVDAPADLRDQAENLIRAINPRCDLSPATTVDTDVGRVVLGWGCDVDAPGVSVHADRWNIVIDQPPADGTLGPCEAGAAIAAAAVATGELFRACFAEFLTVSGRTDLTPVTWNVITLEPWDELPRLGEVELSSTHLVGAGAIGQAFMLTLHSSRVSGSLVVVDPEEVDLSNLQRYILTVDGDEGRRKTDLAVELFAGTGVTVQPVASRWGQDPACRSPETLVVGVDSGRLRIQVQASLPRVAYNAFTGPLECGWSRHPTFGEDQPCVACHYWPRSRGRTTVQQVAQALGVHERRVEWYMAVGRPVGQPLPAQVAAGLGAIPEASGWSTRSLLEDVVGAGRLPAEAAEQLHTQPVDNLFQRVACGVQRLDGQVGAAGEVPLAHQSLLAGAMLAVQRTAWEVPALREHLPGALEYRLPALHDPATPYAHEQRPVGSCICRDTDFVAFHHSRWGDADS